MYNTRFIMSDGSVIYPAYLDREDKEKLRSQQGKQRGVSKMWVQA